MRLGVGGIYVDGDAQRAGRFLQPTKTLMNESEDIMRPGELWPRVDGLAALRERAGKIAALAYFVRQKRGDIDIGGIELGRLAQSRQGLRPAAKLIQRVERVEMKRRRGLDRDRFRDQIAPGLKLALLALQDAE